MSTTGFPEGKHQKEEKSSVSTRNVREHILTVASDLFYREGVHAVGVDTIIARAGVAKSSLYRYFRTKDELIAAYSSTQQHSFCRARRFAEGAETVESMIRSLRSPALQEAKQPPTVGGSSRANLRHRLIDGRASG